MIDEPRCGLLLAEVSIEQRVPPTSASPHAGREVTAFFLATFAATWSLWVALSWAAAVYFLARMKGASLSDGIAARRDGRAP